MRICVCVRRFTGAVVHLFIILTSFPSSKFSLFLKALIILLLVLVEASPHGVLLLCPSFSNSRSCSKVIPVNQ